MSSSAFKRRLPVYLVLDCSGSMSGDPIQAVNAGVKALVADLMNEPYAIETAYLSVITFESTARQVSPLTELMSFQPPTLSSGGATSMGEALKLLAKCMDQEVQKSSETQKGDWKPLVFLMTDGMPTDSWQKAADELKKKKPANIIACAAGSGADESLLKRITEIVVKLDNLQPDTLKQFFKWVTQSIQQTSQSVSQVMADNQPINLPPPPQGITIVP
ncbi:VWA domain-containing protein [Moorena sp. SIO1F2]|uniref:vWA domain-containing protein n=1 Tax=Moorena sp. SIO1F2 TaxID=2607819 RepID=UPI0025E2B45E|nr:VWA domain-containing protein [Moorena sp. SIO1F2]